MWWLKMTEKAKEHYKSLENYKTLLVVYKQKQDSYLKEHRKDLDKEKVLTLKAQVELLAEILDIRQ